MLGPDQANISIVPVDCFVLKSRERFENLGQEKWVQYTTEPNLSLEFLTGTTRLRK